ncbi:unnamed protein product, partial [Rotaria magnacalcarata]
MDRQGNILSLNQQAPRKKCHESSKSKNELRSSRQNYQEPIITRNLSKRKRDISSQQLSSTIDLAIPKTTSSISIAQSSSK